MTPPIPISKHPRWDGANIAWVTHHRAEARDERDVHPSSRAYPLEDLLRIIGKELDEMDARGTVITETSTGFTASGDIGGELTRREYTHSELASRAESWRGRRGIKP
jgi:hypothetical protein